MNTFVDAARSFRTQFDLNFSEKIIVDFFAGGGGASTGLEVGLNRPVYVAVNPNPKPISMQEDNHPHAKHYV
ncbi:DNA cytosine methyltransferase, partial [Acinetobacter baumannii]|nr:DNA cytosine methyltransferase [Acinetobacter baumannii]